MSHATAEPLAAASSSGDDGRTTQALESIRDALNGLRFGTVSVIVQDGVVVQVERTEKLRLLRRERER
jgi:hypothetical protein